MLLMLGVPCGAQSPSAAAAVSSPKPRKLEAGERAVVKEALAKIYLLHAVLLDLKRTAKADSGAVSKEMVVAGRKAADTCDAVWAALAPMAQASGDEIPTVLSGDDKKAFAQLKGTRSGGKSSSAKDQHAKGSKKDGETGTYAEEFLKIAVREGKALEGVLERLSKAGGADLKDLSTQWGVAVKASCAEFEKLAQASK